MSRRLFVAVVPDGIMEAPNVKSAIIKVKKNLQNSEVDVKWVRPEMFHITLYFLGETADERLVAIKKIIDQISKKHKPVEIELKGIGAFPSEREARVLWMGLSTTKELRAIHEDLAEQFVSAKFPKDEHDFVAHLSIARLRNKQSVSSLISPWIRKKFGEFSVGKLILFESIQTGPFSEYKIVHEAKLSK